MPRAIENRKGRFSFNYCFLLAQFRNLYFAYLIAKKFACFEGKPDVYIFFRYIVRQKGRGECTGSILKIVSSIPFYTLKQKNTPDLLTLRQGMAGCLLTQVKIISAVNMNMSKSLQNYYGVLLPCFCPSR